MAKAAGERRARIAAEGPQELMALMQETSAAQRDLNAWLQDFESGVLLLRRLWSTSGVIAMSHGVPCICRKALL